LAVPVAARREVALAARVRAEIEQFIIAATVVPTRNVVLVETIAVTAGDE
jgi:hypothetical protein